MGIYRIGEKEPKIEETAFVAPGSSVIGDVTLQAMVSVWFNAVLRGDNDPIFVGLGSNIQDGCVCHTDPGYPLHVGEYCTIGHAAILHGCTIGNGSLIGMGSTILNGAIIGQGCLIGANALVTEGKEIPDGALVMGAPGKVVKIFDEEARLKLRKSADVYISKIARYTGQLSAIG